MPVQRSKTKESTGAPFQFRQFRLVLFIPHADLCRDAWHLSNEGIFRSSSQLKRCEAPNGARVRRGDYETIASSRRDRSDPDDCRGSSTSQGSFREDSASAAPPSCRHDWQAAPSRDGLGARLLRVASRPLLLGQRKVGCSATPGRRLGCASLAPWTRRIHLRRRPLAGRAQVVSAAQTGALIRKPAPAASR